MRLSTIPSLTLAAGLALLAACTIPASRAASAEASTATQRVAKPAAVDGAVRQALARINPDARIESIRPSAIPGLLEVRSEGAVVYVSRDGRYLVQGDMYDTISRSNVTDAARAEVHLSMLKRSPAVTHLRFGPKDAKDTLYVFTDITCHYCQAFHKEVPALNRMGIAVEYLAFPRSGPQGEVAEAMAAIWCAKDPQATFTAAVRGTEPNPAGSAACAKRIADQYALGSALEIGGTPGVFSSDGRHLGGYLSAAQVRAALLINRSASAAAASTAGAR